MAIASFQVTTVDELQSVPAGWISYHKSPVSGSSGPYADVEFFYDSAQADPNIVARIEDKTGDVKVYRLRIGNLVAEMARQQLVASTLRALMP